MDSDKVELLKKINQYLEEMMKKGFGEINFSIMVQNGRPVVIKFKEEYTEKIVT